MEKLAENDLTYFYLRHVVIVVTAVTTISLMPVMHVDYSAARLICTILLYVCVLDTIYGLVTKKIAIGNLRKIIVTPKEDNIYLWSYDYLP
jgi:hypothetical protein